MRQGTLEEWKSLLFKWDKLFSLEKNIKEDDENNKNRRYLFDPLRRRSTINKTIDDKCIRIVDCNVISKVNYYYHY